MRWPVQSGLLCPDQVPALPFLSCQFSWPRELCTKRSTLVLRQITRVIMQVLNITPYDWSLVYPHL